MRALKLITVLCIVVLFQIITARLCFADPGAPFEKRAECQSVDCGGICRSRGWSDYDANVDGWAGLEFDREGYLEQWRQPPVILESLGDYAGLAYQWGQESTDRYPDPHSRAEEIFDFVKYSLEYRFDHDEFGLDEFAQNADELARTIDERGLAYGDCEDSAILLIVMYKAAGYRTALVLMHDGEEGHAVCLVRVPGYTRAPLEFEIEGEGGWFWAEGTCDRCVLGEFDQGYYERCRDNGYVIAKEIENVSGVIEWNAEYECDWKTDGGHNWLPWIILFFGVLVITSLFTTVIARVRRQRAVIRRVRRRRR